jgi:hypothetical protein
MSSKLSPIDEYIHDLLRWRKYVLRYHVNGIWDKLFEQAKNVTTAKLVEFKLKYADEVKRYHEAREKAIEMGLPAVACTSLDEISITVNKLRCPKKCTEEIRKAVNKKEDFSMECDCNLYKDKIIIFRGKRIDNEYYAWILIREPIDRNVYDLYYLLDGSRAVLSGNVTWFDKEHVIYYRGDN